jgi:hypothetical protein
MSKLSLFLGMVLINILVAGAAVAAYHFLVVQPVIQQAQQPRIFTEKWAKPLDRLADLMDRGLAEAEKGYDSFHSLASAKTNSLIADASVSAKTNSLTSSLQTVRSQLELYKAQHNDHGPKSSTFVKELTEATNIRGAAGRDFGPYMKAVPANPFTSKNVVGAGPYGSSDWFYNDKTGEFRANDTAGHAAY